MKLLPASLATVAVAAAEPIYIGNGFATYYYDIKQPHACGTGFSLQNQGYVECTHINTNYVVAMNPPSFKDNLSSYYGKRVVVTVNGVTSQHPLFIGDGCERCGTGMKIGHKIRIVQ